MKWKKLLLITAITVCAKINIMAQSTDNTNVAAITQITPKPGAEKEIENAVRFIQEAVSKEPGCLIFSLATEKGNPNTFVLFELFKSQEALDTHRQQAHTVQFGKMLEGKTKVNNVVFLDPLKTYIR
ncbi:hypothetical protein GCM10028819_26460 [Spirosoma humi]